MKFIGNYKDWIDNSWLSYMIENDGFPAPCKKIPEHEFENKIFNKFHNAGYNLNAEWSSFFEKENIPFDIEMPVDNAVLWWFIRQKPGQFNPLHIDQDEENTKNVKRYWMPLQDYEPGHLFFYDDEIMTNYKAGDLYMYPRSDMVHGSCNIGFNIRLALNITQKIK